MKKYLKLFLIIVFFIYGLNRAQAEIPEVVSQAHEGVWKVMVFNAFGKPITLGTAFVIGENMFVTNFHVIGVKDKISLFLNSLHIPSYKNKIFLKQGHRTLELSGILRVSAVEDLVIFKTKEKVTGHLKFSQRYPEGNLFVLGYHDGIKKTLIHLEEHGISDYGYNYEIAANETNNEGMSGSPVLNKEGEVVGVVKQATENILIIRKLSQLEELQRGLIGLDCSDLSLSLCIEQEIKNLKKQAEEGNIRAKFFLGDMYLKGGIVKKNIRKAVKLLSQAEKRDHILARNLLSLIYLREKGVEKTLELLLPSANEGIVHAQGQVALLFSLLDNIEQVVGWAHKAADKGDIQAKFLLATILEQRGDAVKASELYSEAEEHGYFMALERLALKYLNGDATQKGIAFEMLSKIKAQGNLSPRGKQALRDLFQMKGLSCRNSFN